MNGIYSTIVEVIRQSSAFSQLKSSLGAELDQLVAQAFPHISASGTESLSQADLPSNIQLPSGEATRHGLHAIEKIRRDGFNAQLTPEETSGLEAIILLTGRPALYIQDGRFLGAPGGWEVLEDHRAVIQRRISSVGRIEMRTALHTDWRPLATGFVVAEDIIMTNRHVVEAFAVSTSDGRWSFLPRHEARIDFIGEFDIDRTALFELSEIIGVHTHPDCDLALLRVQGTSSDGGSLPAPLPIAAQPTDLKSSDQIYVIGYPMQARHTEEYQQALRIFDGVFGIKRLLPGSIMSLSPERFEVLHDCTTLRGSSGSCVVDLQTHQVIGLHYGGVYRVENAAVALWTLRTDLLLTGAKVPFV